MQKWLAALLCVVVVASAQEGYPLDGTWRAQLVEGDTPGTTIVLILEWDGERIAGTLNPGPSQIGFTDGQLQPDGWKFTFSARDANGGALSFAGALSDIGKYNRVLEGQWTQSGKIHDVRFVRE